MSIVIVTTLGRVQEKGKSYRSLNYAFENGFSFESNFFMQALYEYYKAASTKISKILILGTTSSMWDALQDLTFLDNEELFDCLDKERAKEEFTANTLSLLSQELSKALEIEVDCVFIPAGADQQEQTEVVKIISENIPAKAKVSFDLTHGFRIMPLLQLLSIFYLKQIKDVKIIDIFYGAADMRDGNTAPVIKLDFIFAMLDWLTTLPLIEQSGRFGKLAPLFQEKPVLADLLKKYGLFLRTNQTINAKEVADKLADALEQSFTDNMAELYRPLLQSKLNWRKANDLAEWQILSAKAALRSGDFLRAVILLREARITLALDEKDQMNYEKREAKNRELNNNTDFNEEFLTELRNSLAHANATSKKTKLARKVQELLNNETLLTEKIEKIADNLYNQLRK